MFVLFILSAGSVEIRLRKFYYHLFSWRVEKINTVWLNGNKMTLGPRVCRAFIWPWKRFGSDHICKKKISLAEASLDKMAVFNLLTARRNVQAVEVGEIFLLTVLMWIRSKLRVCALGWGDLKKTEGFRWIWHKPWTKPLRWCQSTFSVCAKKGLLAPGSDSSHGSWYRTNPRGLVALENHAIWNEAADSDTAEQREGPWPFCAELAYSPSAHGCSLGSRVPSDTPKTCPSLNYL